MQILLDTNPVPVSPAAMLVIDNNCRKNRIKMKWFKVGLITDIIGWTLLECFASAGLATVSFFLGLFGLVMFLLFTTSHVSSIQNYFMVTRLNADTIEIRIHDKEYEKAFREVNNLVS